LLKELPALENLPRYDFATYQFRFSLCINKMDFAVSYYFQSYKQLDSLNLFNRATMGFNIGIVSNLRLGTFFDLRFFPTLSFGARDLDYTMRKNSTTYVTDKVNRHQHFLISLLLKYKSARLYNTRALCYYRRSVQATTLHLWRKRR